MEAAATHLRPVPDGPNHTAIAKDVRKGDLLVIDPDSGQAVESASSLIAGLYATVEWQARRIGALERQESGDVDSDPKGSEIRALFSRWQTATGRTTTKLGKPRVKLVRSRLRDGFPITSDEWLPPEPTLELAVDGIAAFPFRRFTERHRDGKPSELENDFDLALRDERHVEALARYGYRARKEGLVTWQA